MKSRQDLPRYAEYDAITLTREQFFAFCKTHRSPWYSNYNETIRVTRTKDGNVWAEVKGDVVFWANRWHQIPKTVYPRAKKFMEGLEKV